MVVFGYHSIRSFSMRYSSPTKARHGMEYIQIKELLTIWRIKITNFLKNFVFIFLIQKIKNEKSFHFKKNRVAQCCHHFYWMVRNVVLLFVISEDTPGHSRYTCTQYRSTILHMSHSSILKNIKNLNFSVQQLEHLLSGIVFSVFSSCVWELR